MQEWEADSEWEIIILDLEEIIILDLEEILVLDLDLDKTKE